MDTHDGAPLHGVRAVTLAVNVPGPVAAARLRTLGATVVKIEPPAGDPLEAVSAAWYRELRAGQEVVQLNLKEDGDRRALDDLLGRADLLLTAGSASPGSSCTSGSRASRRSPSSAIPRHTLMRRATTSPTRHRSGC